MLDSTGFSGVTGYSEEECYREIRRIRERDLPQVVILQLHGKGFGLRTLDFANCSRHFSTRSLMPFSSPCSVGW